MLLCEKREKPWGLSRLPVAQKINEFLYSPYFLLVLSSATVIGHVFELEMLFYWLYTFVMIYVALFGRDFLLLIPLTINCYIMPSCLNNPGKHEGSIFFVQNGAYLFIVMGALMLTAAVVRMIFDPEIGFRRIAKTDFKLLWGMLAVGAAYLLSGVGKANYTAVVWKNLGFAMLQFIAIFALYFILRYSVKWEQCDKHYFAYVLLLMGLVIGIEILNTYAVNDVIKNGAFYKENLYVGWGISTNIGMHIALAIPSAFYLIHKGKNPLLYNFLAILLCLFVVITTSRAAILGAAILYAFGIAFVFFKSREKRARVISASSFLLFLCVVVGVSLAVGILDYAFANGLQSQTRVDLYLFGLKQFKDAPLFGNGFFSLNGFHQDYQIWDKVEGFSAGFPERWHNTIIQLLVSCGAIGLLAYGYHRYQTLKLFLTKVNDEKIFIGAAMALLLALSLVDCHFFNVGPVLIYSCALAFVEGTEGGAPASAAEQENDAVLHPDAAANETQDAKD